MKPLACLISAVLAVAAGPVPLDQLQARARVCLDKSDYAAALAEAKSLNSRNPDEIAGYQLMAEAHLGLGNYDEADKALQYMLDMRIGKADSKGWFLIARFRDTIGDLDGALDAVNMAYARVLPGGDAERRSFMVYSGDLLRRLGKLSLAERALVEAMKSGSDDTAALRGLARLRVAQNRRDEALALLRKAAGLRSDPEIVYELAEMTGDSADWDKFEQAARAIAESPGNANRELALYLAGAGKRPAEALEMARRESQRRHDVFTLDSLAVALFANGKATEARNVMRRVLETGNRDSGIVAHAAAMGVQPE